MINKYIVLLLLSVLISPAALSAQTATPTAAQTGISFEEQQKLESTTKPNTLPVRTREALQAEKMRMQEQSMERKEQMSIKREEFTEKMTEIKDTRKQAVLENLDERVVIINKAITDRMLKNLDKMEEILARLQVKVDAAETDTTVAQTSIDEAEIAIDAARASVEDQQAKEYVIEISNETAVKTDAKTFIQELKTDLKTVHEVVKGARQAVVLVAREVAKLQPINKEPSITASPTDAVDAAL
ncbi:MAG: hypothetical protein ACEQSA_04280 [Weeksellaceae bacterium]